jgi:hypothetical protein
MTSSLDFATLFRYKCFVEILYLSSGVTGGGDSRSSRTPLCQKIFYSTNMLVVCFAPPAPRSQISDNNPPPFSNSGYATVSISFCSKVIQHFLSGLKVPFRGEFCGLKDS